MSEKTTPICDYGQNAYDFKLICTNNKIWTLDNLKGEHGLLLFFICNHCPFVKAIIPKLVRVTNTLIDHGINSVGIMSNDVNDYPEDSFENMKEVAKKNKFSFPYLYDETQEVAKKYGAVCTPDFFGYNLSLELQYRGRLDDNWQQPHNVTREELRMAIEAVLNGNEIDFKQIPSMGCNIKWK